MLFLTPNQQCKSIQDKVLGVDVKKAVEKNVRHNKKHVYGIYKIKLQLVGFSWKIANDMLHAQNALSVSKQFNRHHHHHLLLHHKGSTRYIYVHTQKYTVKKYRV